MKQHAQKIIELRSQGKTYKEIIDITGCSKGTVAYHCGPGQKEKKQKRDKKRTIAHRIELKAWHFQKALRSRAEDFQRPRVKCQGESFLGKRDLSFSWKDVIEKFGWETTCYLTGRKIDLTESSTFSFDHIKPVAHDGPNELDNLGITCKNANRAKSDMSVAEFVQLCKEVCEHHGYKVTL